MLTSKRLILVGAFIALIATAITSAAAPRFASLHQFAGGVEGSAPYIRLVADSTGAMYGTTANGGIYSLGAVFQMLPPASAGKPWTYSTIYSFGTSGDGALPYSSLTVDAAGNLYGTTYQGGSANLGTVFQLAPPSVPGGNWTETILHSFVGGSDGRNPYGGVTFDANGKLYGTTQQGGPYLCTEQKLSCGTIYQLTPAAGTWTETVLYSFQGRADGAFPDTALAIDGAGALYGTTTFSGGTNPKYGGVVFQLAPSAGTWTFATLHDFSGAGQPSFEGDVVLDSKGAVFGTSWSGGTSDMGFVYRLRPPSVPGGSWTMATLWNFSGTDGSLPQGGVIVPLMECFTALPTAEATSPSAISSVAAFCFSFHRPLEAFGLKLSCTPSPVPRMVAPHKEPSSAARMELFMEPPRLEADTAVAQCLG